MKCMAGIWERRWVTKKVLKVSSLREGEWGRSPRGDPAGQEELRRDAHPWLHSGLSWPGRQFGY
jgi:hypothetical protein